MLSGAVAAPHSHSRSHSRRMEDGMSHPSPQPARPHFSSITLGRVPLGAVFCSPLRPAQLSHWVFCFLPLAVAGSGPCPSRLPEIQLENTRPRADISASPQKTSHTSASLVARLPLPPGANPRARCSQTPPNLPGKGEFFFGGGSPQEPRHAPHPSSYLRPLVPGRAAAGTMCGSESRPGEGVALFLPHLSSLAAMMIKSQKYLLR